MLLNILEIIDKLVGTCTSYWTFDEGLNGVDIMVLACKLMVVTNVRRKGLYVDLKL